MRLFKYYSLRLLILFTYALGIGIVITVTFGTLLIVDYYAKEIINEKIRQSFGWLLGLFLSGLIVLGLKRLLPYLEKLDDFAKSLKKEK